MPVPRPCLEETNLETCAFRKSRCKHTPGRTGTNNDKIEITHCDIVKWLPERVKLRGVHGAETVTTRFAAPQLSPAGVGGYGSGCKCFCNICLLLPTSLANHAAIFLKASV